MFRALGLRIRSINNYKDTGFLFKDYYFFSRKISSREIEKFKINKNYVKITKSKLIWVYDLNNQLVNDKPFLSIRKAAETLNFNRKTIFEVLDSNEIYDNYKFYSSQLH